MVSRRNNCLKLLILFVAIIFAAICFQKGKSETRNKKQETRKPKIGVGGK
jgi:hypothetical protein